MTDEERTDEAIEGIQKALSKEDPLGMVIRGHLFVESQLIQLLENALPDPGAIDLTRLSFPTKLDLAAALKLLSEARKRGYLELNRLRNSLAHNLDVELRESDEKRLHKALTELEKELADKLIAAGPPDHPWEMLRCSIAALCTDISVLRVAKEKEKK